MTLPLRKRAALAAAATLAVATVTTGVMAGTARAQAQAPTPTQTAATGTQWTENLSRVRSSDFNVAWTGRALTVKDSHVHATTSHDVRGYAQDVLPEHSLAKPANAVTVTLTADRPAGSETQADVRGLGLNGQWTQWVPAAATGATRLPTSVSTVQARITLWDNALGTAPAVTGLVLDANSGAASTTAPSVTTASLSYQVYATREGLVGGTTANGHVIQPSDHFVALPSGSALSPQGSGTYSVQVCGPARCETAPVWDIGPWNTRDDYWDASRAEFTNLAQGMPEAQAAYQTGYNGGLDQFGRTVTNPAGIDLADGTFYNVGLNDNGWVTVTYLWTGGGSGPSVTGMSQCSTSLAADCWNTAVGNGSDCYSSHFCIYTGTGYTGTVFSFYHCRYNGGDWALQNWLSAGSYINRNSGGTDAYLKDQNHNVITATAPGSSNTDYNFDPVYFVQAC